MARKREYTRPQLEILLDRLREPRRFIQVLAGPRQVGKTTLVRQALARLELPSHYASADDPGLQDSAWISAQWEAGRIAARAGAAVLVLDEVQKIPRWSDVVKRLWDEDAASGLELHVVLLGSAPLLVQRGLGESLAGRFELVRLGHWSLDEMREAFGFDLDAYVSFGGYPGAASLVTDPERWAAYVRESLVETTLSRDVLLLSRVDKPALLRQVFKLACDYSGQILSYTKLLGQLQDAGNTTTIAHYLELLAAAGLVTGLQKFSGSRVRQRGSSPKLLAMNTALVTSQPGRPLSAWRTDPDAWGRLVETAVGAHLLSTAASDGIELFYWREGNREVDFVLRSGDALTAIEVTARAGSHRLAGLDAFERTFGPARTLLVGGGGMALEECLATPARDLVR